MKITPWGALASIWLVIFFVIMLAPASFPFVAVVIFLAMGVIVTVVVVFFELVAVRPRYKKPAEEEHEKDS